MMKLIIDETDKKKPIIKKPSRPVFNGSYSKYVKDIQHYKKLRTEWLNYNKVGMEEKRKFDKKKRQTSLERREKKKAQKIHDILKYKQKKIGDFGDD